VRDIAYVIVFLESLFSREFAGFTGLVSKAIRGRDDFRRDFGRGRCENLSGAISWLTFSRRSSRRQAEAFGGGNSLNRRCALSESRGAFAVQPSRPAAAASDASMSWLFVSRHAQPANEGMAEHRVRFCGGGFGSGDHSSFLLWSTGPRDSIRKGCIHDQPKH
jgi:hypothetical protein